MGGGTGPDGAPAAKGGGADPNGTLVAMSGGVDSSVAAYLLKADGRGCAGLTMVLHRCAGASHGGGAPGPTEPAHVAAARRAAMALAIPHRVADLTGEFRRRVIGPFIEGYMGGRTPNPCVECNRHVKFGALLDLALGEGFAAVATGHYARLGRDPGTGRRLLLRGADSAKDQSYFLYALSQAQLSRACFPIGSMRKGEVRKVAEGLGLAPPQGGESSDLCFVADGGYADYIARETGGAVPGGDFVGPDGAALGRHSGIHRYTVGQRRGLGVPSASGPLYVLGVDAGRREVRLGGESGLYSRRLLAAGVNWIPSEPPGGKVRVTAKVRYAQPGQAAMLEMTGEGEAVVEFGEPQRAVTPGQSVVMYDGDCVLGGGVIVRALG
ncbi:MAG: tRNA 2-thiouridine(34) synthase MnmA [Oscillospiraceae bacterium]|nr:tRNA 2-thiouridine(34) synthase MnmA [Oscillospiraceae bacterium]